MKLLSRRTLAASVCFFSLAGLLAIPGTSVAQETSAPGQINEADLGNLLKAMGLKPTKTEKRYDFRFKAVIEGEEWELSMSAVLSQNGQSIWVMAWLDELPRSASDVPRTALLRMLSLNDRLGKGKFFAYIASNRRFVLQRVIANEQISTKSFRDDLQDLGVSVAQTYGYWSVANWTQKVSEPQTDKSVPTNPTAARKSDPATRRQ